MESILTSIKKSLGITEDNTFFDDDLIMHINSTISILTQIGVGPKSGFCIKSDQETWDELLENYQCLDLVKSYVFFRVKLMFDPPRNSNTRCIKKANRRI